MGDEVVYVAVSNGMSPIDDFDVMAYRVDAKVGSELYAKKRILYAEIEADGMKPAAAGRSAGGAG